MTGSLARETDRLCPAIVLLPGFQVPWKLFFLTLIFAPDSFACAFDLRFRIRSSLLRRMPMRFQRLASFVQRILRLRLWVFLCAPTLAISLGGAALYWRIGHKRLGAPEDYQQTQAQGQSEDRSPEILYDMGVIRPNASIQRTIHISNNSDVTWTVRRVSSDCGCTVQRVVPNVLPPGASCDLELVSSSPGLGGVGV